MLDSRSRSLTFLALAFLGAACSASAGDGGIGTDDGGASDGSSGDGASSFDSGGNDGGASDTGSADTGKDSSTVTSFHGRLVDSASAAEIAGGSVSSGTNTAVSSATGIFDLPVTLNLPFTATATASGYTKLNGQELSVSDFDDFGFLPMASSANTSALQGTLAGYDPSKGALIVLAVPTGTCASEAGATFNVSPGGATVNYFSGGVPSASPSVVAGEQPSAVIYNVTPGVALTLTVSSPTCTQVAYPFTQGVLTYTGAMKVESGQAITAARIFLK